MMWLLFYLIMAFVHAVLVVVFMKSTAHNTDLRMILLAGSIAWPALIVVYLFALLITVIIYANDKGE